MSFACQSRSLIYKQQSRLLPQSSSQASRTESESDGGQQSSDPNAAASNLLSTYPQLLISPSSLSVAFLSLFLLVPRGPSNSTHRYSIGDKAALVGCSSKGKLRSYTTFYYIIYCVLLCTLPCTVQNREENTLGSGYMVHGGTRQKLTRKPK